MKSILCALAATALTLPAQEPAKPEPAKPAEAHGHAEGSSPTSGLKKELIAGLTEKDFIKLGEKEKTVKVVLVATWTDDNYGMNFNGHSKGNALYTIPKDWTVEVTFINPGPVPPGYRWSLGLLYLVFAMDVALLYRPCLWFASVKTRVRTGLLRYL